MKSLLSYLVVRQSPEIVVIAEEGAPKHLLINTANHLEKQL